MVSWTDTKAETGQTIRVLVGAVKDEDTRRVEQ
jgi:hypothetical protein